MNELWYIVHGPKIRLTDWANSKQRQLRPYAAKGAVGHNIYDLAFVSKPS
jgi:hypothetical protein